MKYVESVHELFGEGFRMDDLKRWVLRILT